MTDVPQPDELTADEAAHAARLQEFWEVARIRAGVARVSVVTGPGVAATVPPPAWSFGDDPRLADELLALVLDGSKTGTSSSVAELEAAGEPLPRPGDLSIILDGSGDPRALIRTTQVDVVPFDAVDAEFARLEGEDDLSLESWREGHERYFRRVLATWGVEFSADLPVVLERFELLHPTPGE